MKLQKKDAKLYFAMLALGILITLAGCLLPNKFLVIRIILLIVGIGSMWAVVFWAKPRFKCPHCGLVNITPLWNQEPYCPVCNKRIHWE